MPRYLLTPSLFAAWSWATHADDAERARKDLITYLKREQVVPSAAMLEGRKFEDNVRAIADGEPLLLLSLEDPRYQEAVEEIAAVVKGGLWQERIYHDLRFRAHGDFLLYGKIDVLKGPWVHDIKWVAGRYEVGKYGKGIQHAAYMAGSGCPKFAYLASDGRSVWREDYFYSRELYEQMRSRLSEMLDDIGRDRELSRLYAEHWQADRR